MCSVVPHFSFFLLRRFDVVVGHNDTRATYHRGSAGVVVLRSYPPTCAVSLWAEGVAFLRDYGHWNTHDRQCILDGIVSRAGAAANRKDVAESACFFFIPYSSFSSHFTL